MFKGDADRVDPEEQFVAALSACPGGDCSSTHSSDEARCYPLKVEVFKPAAGSLAGWRPAEPSRYPRTHGL